MKFVISAIIIIGLCLGAWQLHHYWDTFNPEPSVAPAPAAPQITGSQLPGLPPELEGDLQEAEKNGSATLRAFLHDHASQIQDPRLAWIQLDYVILAGESDLPEARRTFAKVKARIDSTSPVYPRLKMLEKTYTR